MEYMLALVLVIGKATPNTYASTPPDHAAGCLLGVPDPEDRGPMTSPAHAVCRASVAGGVGDFTG